MAAAKGNTIDDIVLELYNITFADIKRYAGRKFNEKNFNELFIETFAVYTYYCRHSKKENDECNSYIFKNIITLLHKYNFYPMTYNYNNNNYNNYNNSPKIDLNYLDIGKIIEVIEDIKEDSNIIETNTSPLIDYIDKSKLKITWNDISDDDIDPEDFENTNKALIKLKEETRIVIDNNPVIIKKRQITRKKQELNLQYKRLKLRREMYKKQLAEHTDIMKRKKEEANIIKKRMTSHKNTNNSASSNNSTRRRRGSTRRPRNTSLTSNTNNGNQGMQPFTWR